MAHIKDVKIGNNTYLIEPAVYAATTGTAAAITAAINNFALATGVTATLKITTSNAAAATLNINNTGAKTIRYNNANITADMLKVNKIYSFLYDGTYWQLIGDLDTWRSISDAVDSTSSDVSASSKAVKDAYDLADGKVSKSGDTMTGPLILHREGTTEEDLPASIQFSIKDTTKNTTYNKAYISAFQDHGTSTVGTNLVICPRGNLILGGGDSADSFYTNIAKNSTTENTYLLADSSIYVESKCGDINNLGDRIGFRLSTQHNIVPIKAETPTNNIGSIGTADYKWASMYATTFNGNLVGNVTGNVTGTATNVTGVVDVTNGGTGASTQEGARANLGLGTMATENADYYPKLYAGTASTSCIITGSFSMSTETWRYSRSDAATTVKSALGTDNSTTNQWLNKKGEWSTPPDTHYTTHLYVNATADGATSNAATTNTTTYMHLYDNSIKRETIQFKGDGATTVTATGDGVVTISSTDNNTYVTQSNSTTPNWRKILLHYSSVSTATASATNTTNVVYGSPDVAVQPSTGTLRANIYRVADNVELQWNDTDQSLDFVFI